MVEQSMTLVLTGEIAEGGGWGVGKSGVLLRFAQGEG